MTENNISNELNADKGLKAKSLNLASSIVVGVSSTAPAYSIAATLGWIVTYAAFQSPAIILLGFIPILFIALAYRELNRETPDCGTTFTWATRVFNPWVGWMGGWGLISASVIAMASAAQIAGKYLFLMFDAETFASSTMWVTGAGCIWLAIFTWVSWKGVTVSAKLQYWLLAIETIVLLIFSVVALAKVYGGDAPLTAVQPDISWLNPFAIQNESGNFSMSAVSGGLVLAVFLYWGWDSAVSLNEETNEPNKTPGRAAVISTVILLGLYALSAIACLAYVGADPLQDSDDVLAQIGALVLGTNFDKILIFAVLTSAAASTQTTIMPTARTLLSMAAFKALPKKFANIHPENKTPGYATVMTGIACIIFFAGLAAISDNVLGDATEAVGLLVAFYYGLTGFAGAWHFRRNPGKTIREFLVRILLPLIGGLILLFVFVRTAIDDADPEWGSTSLNLFGWQVGGIFVIAVSSLILGIILMFGFAVVSPDFFKGKTLNRHTPIIVAEHVYAAESRLSVPDAKENTIIPPD